MAIRVQHLKELSHKFTGLYNRTMEAFNRIEVTAKAQSRAVEARLATIDRGKDEDDPVSPTHQTASPPLEKGRVVVMRPAIGKQKADVS